MAELTVLQSKFIANYMRHGVGSRAVIEAGGSPNGASVAANRLLKNPKVAAEIARRRQVSENRTQLNADMVMNELKNLVVSNVQDLFDDQGNLKPIHELPADVAKTISSLEMGDKGPGIKKLKQHSKLGAIELASKLLGMLKNQEAAQASVTILLGPAPELPAPIEHAQLKPEW
jgi:phage terminase small subunit